MLGKLTGVNGLIAGVLLGLSVGWVVQGWHKDSSHNQAAARWANERIALADATAAANRAAMEDQQRLYEMINEVTIEADEKMRRLVATERAAADKRVRDQAAAFARRSRSVACATNPAQPGAAGVDPAGVLAELLGELDEMAGIYAAEADRARIAGVACERAYRAVR